MSGESSTVTVEILDHKYDIRCPIEEVRNLQQASHYLNRKMKQLRQQYKQHETASIAVLAAITLSHELLKERGRNEQYIDAMEQRIQKLQQAVSQSLDEKAPLF